MAIYIFKSHTIIRSNPAKKARYDSYKTDLRRDFCGRCAYCNLKDTRITTSFEIDHFIPKSVCEKNDRIGLITDYNNLVYSCKKCNVAKGNQFAGDIHSDNPTNDLFYDPVLNDYNDIFYRNENGSICSYTEKGKQQIKLLKLYRPIHAFAYICEKTDEIVDRLELAIDKETDDVRKQKLKDVYCSIVKRSREYDKLFIAAYNDNDFTFTNG